MRIVEQMKVGLKKVSKNKALLVCPLLYLFAIAVGTYLGIQDLQKLPVPFLSRLFVVAFGIMMIEFFILGIMFIFIYIGRPILASSIEKKLLGIGFTDKKQQPPTLLSKDKFKNGSIYKFYSKEIPLSEYEKRKSEIETLLNIKIVSITTENDMQHIKIKAVSKFFNRNKMLLWDNKYLSNKDFELVLGETDFNTEIVDISSTPHILIGGGSGSGKSKLLKLMLYQCLEKSATVFIADFKGGVDYPKIWHTRCNIITEAKALNEQLTETLEIIEERRNLLISSQTPNISEYNEKINSNLNRIIIACDEIAEILDKTGLGKEEKELVGKIESKLSTIARQGRAFGVHLILATQRPDSDILKGQIKNNIGYKVCGRADKVLSQIILDNSEGAEMILPTDQGMFYTNSKNLFKAYYFNDDLLKGGDKNEICSHLGKGKFNT